MWRPHQTNAKWRFILKDTDFGLGLWDANPVTHNALEYNTEEDDDNRKLFNALLTQDSFRKEFYSRFAIYMGDLLHYKSTSQVIDSIQQLIEPAKPDHIARWEPEMGWGDMNWWYSQIDEMKNWCYQRNAIEYKQLQDFFQLGAVMQLSYEKADSLTDVPAVTINGVRMRDSGLDASYFQNEVIDLHYDGDTPRYGWEITQTVDETTTVKIFFQQDLSCQIPDGCTSLRIKLVGDPTGITPAVPSAITLSTIDNQLQISNLQFPSVISVYDVSGKLIIKTKTSDSSITVPLRRKGIFIVKALNDTQKLIEKVVSR